MSLVIKAGAEATDDYHVMHGELKVGQIYKRLAALRAEWLASSELTEKVSGSEARNS